jgi:hypothetical protein
MHTKSHDFRFSEIVFPYREDRFKGSQGRFAWL